MTLFSFVPSVSEDFIGYLKLSYTFGQKITAAQNVPKSAVLDVIFISFHRKVGALESFSLFRLNVERL